MQPDRITDTVPDRPDFPGVCIATGYTVSIRTQYGHLRVEDETSQGRRIRKFARATVPFSRLVIRSVEGYISTGAIRWARDVGIAVYMIDSDGEVMAVSGDIGADRPDLRRAQGRATETGLAVEITRWLVQEKLKGQARVALRLPSPVTIPVPDLYQVPAQEPADFLPIEGEAASAYWRGWEHVKVQFVKADERRIPEHWRFFGRRSSPISGTPRRAGSPGSAALNYLYSIAAAEAQLACLGMGLDPGLGVYHVDKRGRDSMVYDLIEPIRPVVDEYLLDLLEGHVFRAGDFYETRRGVCRIAPALAAHLAAVGPLWANHIGPVAEHVAQMLLPGKDLPTPLTHQNLRAERDTQRRKPTRAQTPKVAMPPAGCRECGNPTRGLYCDNCRPDVFREAGRRSAAIRAEAGESQKTRAKRAAANSRRREENLRWEKSHKRPHPDIFHSTILPGLADVTLSAMVKATGLSKPYCSLIRRGEFVPHPRHWNALTDLASESDPMGTVPSDESRTENAAKENAASVATA